MDVAVFPKSQNHAAAPVERSVKSMLSESPAKEENAATGNASTVMIIVSLVAGQMLFPVEVRTSITLPAITSCVLIEYVAFSAVAFGEKEPVPVVVQMPVDVMPDTSPFSATSV